MMVGSPSCSFEGFRGYMDTRREAYSYHLASATSNERSPQDLYILQDDVFSRDFSNIIMALPDYIPVRDGELPFSDLNTRS